MMPSVSNPLKSIFSEHLYRILPKVAIVLDTPWNRLSEKELKLLSAILAAINCNLSGVHIIEAATVDLSNWVQKPQKLISFGAKIKDTTLYELLMMHGTYLVCADTLTILLNDPHLKRKLWLALQQAFPKN